MVRVEIVADGMGVFGNPSIKNRMKFLRNVASVPCGQPPRLLDQARGQRFCVEHWTQVKRLRQSLSPRSPVHRQN